MKKILYVKFLAAYILLGFLGFIVISSFGSKLVEDQLITQTSDALYQEAYSIASSNAAKSYSKSDALDDLYNNLKDVATYQNAQIWVLDTSGSILINTATSLNQENPASIPGFDPAAFGPKYYEVSHFYNQLEKEHLNVMVPITANMRTRGYVSIHYPMDNIYEQREALLMRICVVFAVIFALSLLLLGLFTVSVYIPLQKVITGAKEYASGNLKYNIDINTNDEMGYLASTMNYMGDELERSNEYQKQFVANVSHDFRSPLTSIKGYAEAISDGTIPQEMYPKYLGIITSEAERLEKLTRSMLYLNNMDKQMMLNIESFDINAVIKDTAAVFEVICRQKKIQIELLLSGKNLYVSADKGKIQQVLYNLLDNAIKFSNKSSTIMIETTEKHGRVYISVKDTGVGIPKEKQNKIWDRFYKIDISRGKDRKGTGLGLAIVKEIINAHEQNITVISTEGVGTEFIFTLNKA